VAKTKLSVYSIGDGVLVGSWTKDAVEKEINENDWFPAGDGEWVERALKKALAGEKGLDLGAVASVLKWSASGAPSGGVTFTRPSDGTTVSVLLA